jgi:DNA-directed RNA polymerase specialized sigma24 family protein
MTLGDALRESGRAGAARAAAVAELRKELGRLARRISENHRDDVLQDVLLRIVAGPPIPVLGGRDAQIRSYLRRMLHHRYVSYLRGEMRLEKRHRAAARELIDLVAPEQEDTESDGATFEEVAGRARGILDGAFAAAVEARDERYRAPLKVAWRQILELHDGKIDMPALLQRDEGVRDDADADEKRRAAARVHTAHRRARNAVADAVQHLRDCGELSAEDARAAEAYLQLLFRCQSARRQASTRGEG